MSKTVYLIDIDIGLSLLILMDQLLPKLRSSQLLLKIPIKACFAYENT